MLASSCHSRHDTDRHEREVHADRQSKPAPAAAPTLLRDTVQLLAQHSIMCGASAAGTKTLPAVLHAGTQRLAAVEVSQGKDSTPRALAQHVLKGHERDNHMLTLALTRDPPGGMSTGTAIPKTLYAANNGCSVPLADATAYVRQHGH